MNNEISKLEKMIKTRQEVIEFYTLQSQCSYSPEAKKCLGIAKKQLKELESELRKVKGLKVS